MNDALKNPLKKENFQWLKWDSNPRPSAAGTKLAW